MLRMTITMLLLAVSQCCADSSSELVLTRASDEGMIVSLWKVVLSEIDTSLTGTSDADTVKGTVGQASEPPVYSRLAGREVAYEIRAGKMETPSQSDSLLWRVEGVEYDRAPYLYQLQVLKVIDVLALREAVYVLYSQRDVGVIDVLPLEAEKPRSITRYTIGETEIGGYDFKLEADESGSVCAVHVRQRPPRHRLRIPLGRSRRIETVTLNLEPGAASESSTQGGHSDTE